MSIKIKIPTPLREFTNGESTVVANGENIKDLISVAHYFLGDYEYAKRLLDNNIYISVAKPFLRDNDLAEVISKLPLDKLVIETDSYPQYFKKNRMRWTEPKDLIIIVKKPSSTFRGNHPYSDLGFQDLKKL